LLVAFDGVCSAQWWNAGWKYRRKVVVQPPSANAGLLGSEVGYVEFRTSGNVQPDGRDVVVIGRGKPVSSKMLQLGPGDLCKVVFEIESGLSTYYLYYGNGAALKKEVKWEPQRGLLLETRKYVGGGCAAWNQMQDSMDRSKGNVFGVGYQPNVFLGFNPFGPSENYISIYKGWLYIKQKGNYGFATTSSDASFLFVDDKLIVHWAGYRRAIPQAQYTTPTPIPLEAGLHKFAYYHLKAIEEAAAVAAWQPPLAHRYEVIPESVFPKVTMGVLLDFEYRGEPADDFSATNAGELLLASSPLVKMHFENTTKIMGGLSAIFDWDFGDGNKGEGRIVDHVYLSPGTYKVKMVGRIGSGKHSAEHEVAVDRDWSKQVGLVEDKMENYAAFIEKYSFDAMKSADLVMAAQLMDQAGKSDVAARLCELVLKRSDLEEKTFYETALMLGRLLRTGGQNADRVVAAYRSAEEKINNPKLRAQLSMAEGEELLAVRGNEDAAMKEFQEVIGKFSVGGGSAPGGVTADDETRRKAYIAIGDVYKRKGNYEKAKEYYEKAQQVQLVDLPFKREAVKIGAYARAVESYLRENNQEDAKSFLSTWQWEYPTERLEGPSSIYWARLHMAQQDHKTAVVELEEFVAANPKSSFAPEALMQAVECYKKLGQTEKALSALKSLANDYKDSPLATKAEEELKKGVASPPEAPKPKVEKKRH
jgi:TolA-binding protein